MFLSRVKTPLFVVPSPFLVLILFAPFAFAQNPGEGLLPVEVDGKHGFISTRGEIVIPASFEFAWGFREGLASAWSGGKAGFIDESGTFVIPPQFEYARAFVNGLADAELGARWGYIDKKGRFVIPPRYAETRGFSEGLAVLSPQQAISLLVLVLRMQTCFSRDSQPWNRTASGALSTVTAAS